MTVGVVDDDLAALFCQLDVGVFAGGVFTDVVLDDPFDVDAISSESLGGGFLTANEVVGIALVVLVADYYQTDLERPYQGLKRLTLDEVLGDSSVGAVAVEVPNNDLVPVDHCPGFPSAAKLAAQVTHATRMDYDAYTRAEVFVLETMGRDAGWLAASCCLSGDVDLLVLPEVDFDKEAFLAEVQKKMDEKNECYIVVSEGAHYADGTYLSAGDSANDGFAHAVLGGAALTLKQMIIDAGIAPRGVVQDLSRAARSSNFAQSLVDVTEAYELGMSAHMRSADGVFTGQVVGVRREMRDGAYNAKFFAGPASEFANHVKHFPTEWILPNYQGITQEAYDYLAPLVEGEPKLIYENGLPATIKAFNRR